MKNQLFIRKSSKHVLRSIVLFFAIINGYCCFAQFPSVYDLRGLGLVSPVKDQGLTCGSCWAFASCASIESSWLKQSYGMENLSEDNLIDCHGFDEAPCAGGSYYMSQALLSIHNGNFSEVDDPYTESVQNCPMMQPFPPSPLAFVEDMLFIPPTVNDIKQAITDYGAVASTMFFNMSNYNASTYKYYDAAIDSNDSLYAHCITIAGWNDTMAFVGAPGLGGWIIKDSYGTSWAQSGYFYCSYYDAGILGESVVFPIRYEIPDVKNRPHVYAHDEFGWVDNFGYGSNQSWGLVKYTIQPSGGVIFPQQIQRIGTYAVADNTTIEFSLYRNKSGNTLSGFIDSETIFCQYKGYYSVPMNLKTDTLGSEIYIKVNYSCPAGVFNPIPIETYEAGHTSGIVVSTAACWASPDGATWNAIGGGTSYQFDLCVKMYAEDAPRALMIDLPDTICRNENIVFNDISPMPKDSVRWFVDDVFLSSGPNAMYICITSGTHDFYQVVYFGNNTDTLFGQFVVREIPSQPTITQIGNTLESSLAVGYQWLDGIMNPIAGAVSQQYIPPAAGQFAVLVFNEFGCSAVSQLFNFIPENINEVNGIQIRFYPNPVHDILYLECDNSEPFNIEIYGMEGKIIGAFDGNNGDILKNGLHVTHLPEGVYVLKLIFNTNEVVFRKIVKE